MKYLLVKLTLVLLVALCAAPANAAVLSNPGFEDGVLAPWFQDRVFSGGEDWNVTNTDAHTGVFSATNTGNKEIRQNFAPVLTDNILEVSFWAKHIGSGSAMFVDLFYDDNTDTGFTVSTVGADSEFFDVTGNLAAGKSLVGFSVFGNSDGPTRSFLDDVVINDVVPEPASFAVWSLLGLVGFGIGWRRRRQA